MSDLVENPKDRFSHNEAQLTQPIPDSKRKRKFLLTFVTIKPQNVFTLSGSSGGDVHITTIDGVGYDFNGHGEYVFLKLKEEYVKLLPFKTLPF